MKIQPIIGNRGCPNSKHFQDKVGTWLKPGASGRKTKGAAEQSAEAAYASFCAPSLKGMLTERRGRDVGLAKSGFRLTTTAYRGRCITSKI